MVGGMAAKRNRSTPRGGHAERCLENAKRAQIQVELGEAGLEEFKRLRDEAFIAAYRAGWPQMLLMELTSDMSRAQIAAITKRA